MIGKRFVGLAVVGIGCFSGDGIDAADQASVEERYYALETYSIPEDLKFEVSGIAPLPGGGVAVAIRKGEVWILEDLHRLDGVQFRKFAAGLHEPLGLAWHEGHLYTVQRTELTRLSDVDGDGVADDYETVAKGWGVTGNYHEYAYGPVFDHDGNAWLTLNCTIGQGTRPDDNLWRGWSLRVAPTGRIEPVSGGFRSPSGLGVNLAGDVFATDQQGNWFPTCPLIHIRSGVFHGHVDALRSCSEPAATFQIAEPVPDGLTVVEAAKRIGPYELPAVWFPYRKMGMSSTDILCDTTKGRFGPFAGQLFVGEFTQSFVSRVFLERVGGAYQGACFRFREGLQSAALRLGWAPGGVLLVGQSNRGWNSLGPRSYGLQRIRPTGQVPFEIRTMGAAPEGFRLTFTLPLDAKTAARTDAYRISSYTYPYRAGYGGPETDRHELQVLAAILGEDGHSVEIEVSGLREGYVHELSIDGLLSHSGLALLHAEAYYTLNRIPPPKRSAEKRLEE